MESSPFSLVHERNRPISGLGRSDPRQNQRGHHRNYPSTRPHFIRSSDIIPITLPEITRYFQASARLAVLVCSLAALSFAQTTQGIITGQIADAHDGNPLPGARITATHVASGVMSRADSDSAGYYFLPLLSPGIYFIRIEAGIRYQAKEVHELELAVAASLNLDLRLRPFDDVWEQKQRQS